MSKRKSQSLLSFIYNTTIDPPYRLEMHMDMEVSFERFAVADAEARNACYEVEQAAYFLRHSSDDVAASGARDPELHARGLKQMDSSTDELFARLRDELLRWAQTGTRSVSRCLAQSIDFRAPTAGPADAPWSAVSVANAVVTAKPGYLLLEYLYFLCHFPDARPAIAALASSGQLPSSSATALQRYGSALSTPGQVNVAADVELLCSALQSEYAQHGWFECW